MARVVTFITFTLSLVFFITGLPAQGAVDINGDGVVNAIDVRALTAVILGEAPPAPVHDINGDQQVDIADLVLVMNVYGGPLIQVPAGTFPMGDQWGNGDADEIPVHDVTLTAYEIGRHKVTVAEYTHFLNTAHAAGEIYILDGLVRVTNSGNGLCYTRIGQELITFSLSGGYVYPEGYGDYPVAQLLWWGSAFYCNWLSRQEGLEPVYDELDPEHRADFSRNGYHLPTEAQWERAAAWDAEIQRHWRHGYQSDTLLDLDNWMPVGTREDLDSPVGCLGMGYNRAEWCHDRFGEEYYGYSPSVDPEGPWDDIDSTVYGKVIRGWIGNIITQRSGHVYEEVGMRLARSSINDTISITIDTIPDEGTWTLTGPSGFSMTGQGDRLVRNAIHDLPRGEYTLVADDNVNDMDPPAQSNGAYLHNRNLGFLALYTGTDGDVEPAMVPVLNEGWFHRGDRFDEGNVDEKPVRPITLQNYAIGRYEITNDEYAAFLNSALAAGEISVANGKVYLAGNEVDPLCQISGGSDWIMMNFTGLGFSVREHEGQPMGDHPAANLSWFGAAAYCNWLSRQMGFGEVYIESGDWAGNLTQNGYHLPTEAQWEKAASWQADEQRHWRYGHSSDTLATPEVNFDNVNPLGFSGSPFTTPVDYYPESLSPYGCHGMTGNVYEWSHDWYAADYYDLGSPSIDPEGPASGETRCARGGAWIFRNPKSCRSADRVGNDPERFRSYQGFRIVREL